MSQKYRNIINPYKTIVLVCFIVLIGLLVHLTYNTFTLHNQQYQNTEKLLIKEYYTNSIRNDKLFPGGQTVMDYYIIGDMTLFETMLFEQQKDLPVLLDSIFQTMMYDLKQKNTMDTLFSNIKSKYQLDEKWQYALVVDEVDITLSEGKTLSLYNFENGRHTERQKVGGQLEKLLKQNTVTSITIGSPLDYSYKVTFTLYADRRDRQFMIFKMVIPILLLGLLCTTTIIVSYLLTYKNWTKQKKLSEMKSDFANSITHEFHTPISTILVANKTLQNNPVVKGDRAIDALTQVISRQTIRLQRLFAQVLDITTMTSSKLVKENANLNELLQEIVSDYNLKSNHEAVTFERKFAEENCVKLNRFFFTTMITNLLENALKHNQKKQKVITVTLRKIAKTIQIIVSDNGNGISTSEISRIFTKFHKSSAENTASGLGLGLYYVKQCVIAHDWSIQTSSEVNIGTEFTISIPAEHES